MTNLALPLVAAAAALFPEVRTFWAVNTRPQPQPAQVEVRARLVREGRTIAVYQEDGYAFSSAGPADEARQIDAAVAAFDTVIYPREVGLFGPCPDRDANGKVILLLTRVAPAAGMFFPFDELSEDEALRSGFHSNQGEVLYGRFARQGNRAATNVQELAETFHRLLHFARDPGETSWSELLANYTPYLCGLASARLLWGDLDPDNRAHAPYDPWAGRGWSLLFIEYLRDKFGEESLRDLVARPERGLAALGRLLEARGDQRTPADLLADFAMACWLDDPGISAGRFSFAGVVPPRPLPAGRAVASRPASGAIEVGVGGIAILAIDGDGERPFPITLQGDPTVRWVGRAVKLHALGPDAELPLAFTTGGTAKVELPALSADERVVLAVASAPGDSPLFDRRTLLLRWGIGWVPHVPADPGAAALENLVKKALPDGGSAARARLMETVDRMGGAAERAGETPPVTTRYAWAPESSAVVDLLQREAVRRGLSVRTAKFVRQTPDGAARQEWTNVLIELPGKDARRWPVVLAAHWDGARGSVQDSYLRALNLDDDASGVAVALEAASAMSRIPHRAPILVSLLAGGYQDAAGARALIAELGGKIATWVELDAVGIPERWPHTMELRLETGKDLPKTPWSLAQSLRRSGFILKQASEFSSPHTGGGAASERGISALVVRVGAGSGELDTPPAVERVQLSPNFMVLLTKALAGVVASLAGAP